MKARVLDQSDIQWLKQYAHSYWDGQLQKQNTLATWVWYSGLTMPNTPHHKKIVKLHRKIKRQQTSLLALNKTQLKKYPKGMIFKPDSKITQPFPIAFQASHIGVHVVRLPVNNRCDF